MRLPCPYLPVKWCKRIAEQETHLCALLDIPTAPQKVHSLLIRKAYQIKEQETAIGKLCVQAVTQDPALKDTPSRIEAVQALSKAVEQQLMKTPNSTSLQPDGIEKAFNKVQSLPIDIAHFLTLEKSQRFLSQTKNKEMDKGIDRGMGMGFEMDF